MNFGIQGQFRADQAWAALLALLCAQLPGVDCQAVTAKDFNESGELVMNPPSLRVYYDSTRAASTADAQRLSYEAIHRFIVLCADQDLSSVANQAVASLTLACNALGLLAGTRLNLPSAAGTFDQSEPLTWVSLDVQPVAGVGSAYCLGLEVPGLAQFPGLNAGGV